MANKALLLLLLCLAVTLVLLVMYATTHPYEAFTSTTKKKPIIARHNVPVATAKPQHLYVTDPSTKYDDPTLCENYYNCLQENSEEACVEYKSDYC